MKVIDNAYVRHSHCSDDLDLVFRLTKPAAMIVKAHRATQSCGRFCNGLNAGRLSFHAPLLFYLAARGFATTHDPKLRSKLVPLDQRQDCLGVVVERGR